MDRLRAFEVFASVVAKGSFTRAAAALETSPANVTRYVNELEAHLGTRLLNRSSRKVSLTESGRALHERCANILDDVAEAEAQVATSESQPRGVLRMSLPHSFGLRYVAPLVPEFCRRYPELQLELNFSDRIVDLVEEGIDMALRITAEPKTGLVARKLAPAPMVCCAAPDYLRQHGVPQTPEALREHECLTYSYAPAAAWSFRRDGRDIGVHVKGRLRANSGDMSRHAAVAGLGIAQLPTFLACDDLRAGLLLPLLVDYAQPELGVYAVYQPAARRSARIRAMVDYLWEALGQGRPPWL